jgi:hypothetical protein
VRRDGEWRRLFHIIRLCGTVAVAVDNIDDGTHTFLSILFFEITSAREVTNGSVAD